MKRILSWLATRIGTGLLAAVVLFVGIAAAQGISPQSMLGRVISPIQKSLLTVGVTGTAYAATPDYLVDGTDDNVQVQAALDALPATGGQVILFAGSYSFDATPTRAIPNVTISGDGKGTYLAHDNTTALLSAGAQTGWVFKDFRTDAGWVTVSSAGDTLLAGNLWNGTSLISNVVASGATMPASPVIGQQFLQDTTGRTWLYQYDGTTWRSLTAYGDTTVYVHSSGTADPNADDTDADAATFSITN